MREITLKNKIKPNKGGENIVVVTDCLQLHDMFTVRAEYCKQNKEKCRHPQEYMAIKEIENNKWRCHPLLCNVRICKTIPAEEIFYILEKHYATQLKIN